MKKFNDARQPLNLVKHRMALKAVSSSSWVVFDQELQLFIDEHNAFQGNMEMKVVIAEAVDAVQVCIFCFMAWVIHNEM
jgi:hypothetical protein|tara:strand:- start:1292 stop:1528 length:237 start_codon:yes stop_codon:yes gene_type:complete